LVLADLVVRDCGHGVVGERREGTLDGLNVLGRLVHE
jgi:hypothetical protein